MLEFIILKRLLLTLLLCGLIGIERERAHKMAGLRTHALVGMGSALLTMLAIYGFQAYGYSGGDAASRIISNIIVGIGFIGGGAILRQENHVVGTTTAATLWLVSAIGIAVGMGFTYGAVLATLFGYVILTVFFGFEKIVLGSDHNNKE